MVTNASIRRTRWYFVLLPEREAGNCLHGHVLVRGMSLAQDSGGRWMCLPCRDEFRKTSGVRGREICFNKLHPLPAGHKGRCPECRKLTSARNKVTYNAKKEAEAKAAEARSAAELKELLTRYPVPSGAILEGAVCRPDQAQLFDPITRDEQGAIGTRAIVDRLITARIICAGCPVREMCLADAVQNERSGVYGGKYVRLGIATEKLFPGRPAHPETRKTAVRPYERTRDGLYGGVSLPA
jgi:hypothetical protein